MRALLNQAFTGSAVLGIEARVTAIADRLLDHMEAGGRFDFIAAFALPLPVALICEIMGIPEEDTPRLHQWSSAFLLDDSVPEEEAGRRVYGAMGAMTEYFAELIAARERTGGEDLLSQMIGAEENGRRLSRDELIGNAMLLLIAGHETTVNLLGNGLLLLLEERGRWEQVQRQPQLLRLGIEEMLRFESPVQLGTYRVAAEPIAIGRRNIEAGAQVTLMLGSANRDPLQFPDPDRFDLARTPNRHLGFGHGPHRCIGAALARIEARLGFTRVIERFPNLRLDTPGPRQQSWFAPIRSLLKLGGRVVPAGPLWRHNPVTRGLRELRVIA
jgi:cytochrome P450